MASHVAGIETADYEIAAVEHDVDALTELFEGASVVLQHGRTVQQARPGGRRGLPRRRRPLPRHHRRAGLADHLRREVRRRLRGRRTAARSGRRADVHDRRDRRPALPRAARPRHPRHRGVLGRQPDDRLDADDPGQRGHLRRRTTSSRTPTCRGTPSTASDRWSSPASTSSRSRCRGAAPRTRSGSSATRGSPTCKALGGVFNTRADARRPADRRRRPRGDQGHGRRTTAVRRPARPPRPR